MKKLMIAAAIVCAAVVANAAAANWKASATTIYDGKGDTASLVSGKTAYIFDAGVTTQTALWTLIQAGTAITSETAGYVSSATVTDGAFSNISFTNGEQGDGNTYNYYFVIVDSKDLAYFSNIKGAKPNGNSTAKNLALGAQFDSEDPTALPNSKNLPSTTLAAGSWVKTAGGDVPEPTSAMLLLLGVAGLALRRKQK